MVHDQHVYFTWHVFLYPAQSLMFISGVGLFPVQSGCSLIRQNFLHVVRCRLLQNHALL